MTDFVVAIVLLGLLGFWWDSLGARQVAREAGRRICEREGVQFLDDTVAISRLPAWCFTGSIDLSTA